MCKTQGVSTHSKKIEMIQSLMQANTMKSVPHNISLKRRKPISTEPIINIGISQWKARNHNIQIRHVPTTNHCDITEDHICKEEQFAVIKEHHTNGVLFL